MVLTFGSTFHTLSSATSSEISIWNSIQDTYPGCTRVHWNRDIDLHRSKVKVIGMRALLFWSHTDHVHKFDTSESHRKMLNYFFTDCDTFQVTLVVMGKSMTGATMSEQGNDVTKNTEHFISIHMGSSWVWLIRYIYTLCSTEACQYKDYDLLNNENKLECTKNTSGCFDFNLLYKLPYPKWTIYHKITLTNIW